MSVVSVSGLPLQVNAPIILNNAKLQEQQFSIFDNGGLTQQVQENDLNVKQNETALPSIFKNGNASSPSAKIADLKPVSLPGASFQSSIKENSFEEALSEKADMFSKLEYDSASEKGSTLSLDFQILQQNKAERTSNINLLIQRRENYSVQSSAQTNLVKTQKNSIHTHKTAMESINSLLKSDIISISSQISSLKAQLSQLLSSIKMGSSLISAASSVSIALDTSETIQQSSGAAGSLAETQNSGNIETEASFEPTIETLNIEQLNDEMIKKIEAQINGLQTQLSAKMSLQDNFNFNINFQESEEDKLDEIENSQFAEFYQFDAKISYQKSLIPDIDTKIELKQNEINKNSELIQQKEEAYNNVMTAYNEEINKKQQPELLQSLKLKNPEQE